MRIYLAARYSRRLELCGYAAQLAELGHVVTSRWLAGDHEAADGTTDSDLRARWAKEDLDDIDQSHMLLAFAEPSGTPHSRGGRHVEFGYALGRSMWVGVVGRPENIFYDLERVEQLADWPDAMRFFAELAEIESRERRLMEMGGAA